MLPLPKALLAAATVTAIALTAVPAAHATWMTGRGSLPLFASDRVCTDGMDFQYATYGGRLSKGVGGVAPTVTIAGLGVWVLTPAQDDIEPAPVVAPADYTISYSPMWIDPAQIGGQITTWPEPESPGVVTHNTRLTLSFNRTLAPGTGVYVAWAGSPNPGWPSSTAWRFTVADCQLIARTVSTRPLSPAPPWLSAR